MHGGWYCKLNWHKWCDAVGPEMVDRMVTKYRDNPDTWPSVGCGVRYRPWRNGLGMVLEFKAGDTWKCFLADVIPELLDNEIKQHQAEWNNALSCLSPDDVYDLIPVTFPRASPITVAGIPQFPGMGKLNLPKLKNEQAPVLSTAGWVQLCLKVASKGENLESVFSLASAELETRMGEDFRGNADLDFEEVE